MPGMLQVTTGWLDGMVAPSSRPTMISSSGSHSLCELTGQTCGNRNGLRRCGVHSHLQLHSISRKIATGLSPASFNDHKRLSPSWFLHGEGTLASIAQNTTCGVTTQEGRHSGMREARVRLHQPLNRSGRLARLLQLHEMAGFGDRHQLRALDQPLELVRVDRRHDAGRCRPTRASSSPSRGRAVRTGRARESETAGVRPCRAGARW